MIPTKLQPGDGVRVIAPARSLAMPWMTDELKQLATKRLEEFGLVVSFSKHVNEIDEFSSSSIESRVEDLHDAFRDPRVKLVLTVIGGFNSNQLLEYLDYELIRSNPKILCGYSDITALSNAIYARTGLVTYSGLHYITCANRNEFEYSLEYFKKCLFSDAPFHVEPSQKWSNDRWMTSEEKRVGMANEGYWVLQEGEAEGKIIGGNLCTLNLLQGTEYMPDIADSILFLEDDNEVQPHTFDRDLQSLIHQPKFETVRGLVIGRFQMESNMTREMLTKIIKTKKELARLPVIANADFGHTMPIITFPIGGAARVLAHTNKMQVEIIEH